MHLNFSRMNSTETKLGCVLVVDDDPHGLAFFESSLMLIGCRVLVATSAQEARKIFLQYGPEEIHAVLSDYRMPDETGIELIQWIREQDENMATLIVTAQGEKSVVQQAMAAGAVDYLEKPVAHKDLGAAIEKAIHHTRRQRKYAEGQQGLEGMRRLDHLLNAVIDPALESRLTVCYHPLHEVGGDFFNTFPQEGNSALIVVGDVAGHDLQSGYVSTYFQGMFRGFFEAGPSIQDALKLFNKSLSQSGLSTEVDSFQISLSVCILAVREEGNSIEYWNYGFAPCLLVDNTGFLSHGNYGSPPLGWLDDISVEPQKIRCQNHSSIYLFTDGLIDFANELEIDPLSLLYILLRSYNRLNDLPLRPSDDILAIRYLFNPQQPLSALFEPILNEQYSGAEYEHVDQLQSVWRRSLQFALSDELGDRLYDLLICIREGMLNALMHGCNQSAEKFCQLQISYNAEEQLIRVRIDDPGKGHEFDLEKSMEQIREQTGKHMGLGIIQHLSDDFQIENKGTSLVFDFYIDPAKAKNPANG